MTYHYLFNQLEEQHSHLTSNCWLSLVEEPYTHDDADKTDYS